MTDIAVIILTKNEVLHIERCLHRLVPLSPRQIFVVDCYSTDGTERLVKKFSTIVSGWKGELQFVKHEWPGFHATQFNWALDNCPICARWVLRLDAD